MQFQLLFLSSLACLASSVAAGPLHFGNLDPAYREYLRQFTPRYDRIRQYKGDKADEQMNHPGNSCMNYDLATAQMPNSTLPPPSPSLSVYHIALGRGTQNYTCQPNNAPAVPIPVGAVANLYNISCHATIEQGSTNTLPQSAIKIPAPSSGPFPQAGPLAVLSGHHYFPDPTTPTFNLVVTFLNPADPATYTTTNYGIMFTKKLNSTTPTTTPDSSALPDTGLGEAKAVPWLKLRVQTSPPAPYTMENVDQNGVQEVYRVNTVGGSAPATCAAAQQQGLIGVEGGPFQVEYAAEYWFWAQ